MDKTGNTHPTMQELVLSFLESDKQAAWAFENLCTEMGCSDTDSQKDLRTVLAGLVYAGLIRTTTFHGYKIYTAAK